MLKLLLFLALWQPALAQRPPDATRSIQTPARPVEASALYARPAPRAADNSAGLSQEFNLPQRPNEETPLGGEAKPPPLTRPAAKKPNAKTIIIVSGGLAAILLGGGIGFLLSRWRRK